MVDRQVEQRRELARLPIDDDMLTEHTASFAIRAVIRTIAEQAPDGASVRDVLEVARIMGRTSVTRCVPVFPSHGVRMVSGARETPPAAAGGVSSILQFVRPWTTLAAKWAREDLNLHPLTRTRT